MEIRSVFESEHDYFEHVISEYVAFLSPILMNSIMVIEDEINRIINSCDDVKIIAGVRKDWDLIQPQVNRAKDDLKAEISKVAKEIEALNKNGMGF